MTTAPRNRSADTPMPVGQMALQLPLREYVPPPAVRSFTNGARKTIDHDGFVEEIYPRRYATDGTVIDNLRFALRYEPLDLRILYATLKDLGAEAITAWMRKEPTGAYSRRIWFLYETLTGESLDLEPARTGNYVDVLDQRFHLTITGIPSSRHRVRDNLFGGRSLCPVVRRTMKLEQWVKAGLEREIQTLRDRYAPEMVARAVNFLYTRETRSSFAIEGETPNPTREQRFIEALRAVSLFDPQKKSALLELQGRIVDPRYKATDYRSIQNFVGETTRGFGEYIHYICPRPEDVPDLMEGWQTMVDRLLKSPIDPVIAAALIAFAFVFIHPFEDGNGRIHRYLIHYALEQREFTPPGVLFPVSAAILRERRVYDRTLEAFSRPLLSVIDWNYTDQKGLAVNRDTAFLYRFFDATAQVEYLFERIAATIREDFTDELNFLSLYDAAFSAVQSIVDMPDRHLERLIRLCLENKGRLSKNKRKQFAELTDEEVDRMEKAIQQAIASTNSARALGDRD